MAKDGVKRVDLICPGFTSDCLETLEEISMEARHDFMQAGGQEFHYIACLNEAPSWIAGMAQIAEQNLVGWPTLMTSAQKDVAKQDAEIGRQNALKLGATV
jgi:ferrochelatase